MEGTVRNPHWPELYDQMMGGQTNKITEQKPDLKIGQVQYTVKPSVSILPCWDED